MKLFGEVGVTVFGVYSYVNEVFLSIFFALSNELRITDMPSFSKVSKRKFQVKSSLLDGK